MNSALDQDGDASAAKSRELPSRTTRLVRPRKEIFASASPNRELLARLFVKRLFPDCFGNVLECVQLLLLVLQVFSHIAIQNFEVDPQVLLIVLIQSLNHPAVDF